MQGGIYGYSTPDGHLILSNIPGDEGFTTLVEDPATVLASPRADSPTRPETAPETDQKRLIEQVARGHRIDPALISAVVAVESGHVARAVSSKGAAGLMQLMPETASRYGISDRFDPAQNLDAGARHLRYLLGLFNCDLSLALAAYNAGEGAVKRHGNSIPPYRETVAYVPKVLRLYESLRVGAPTSRDGVLPQSEYSLCPIGTTRGAANL